MVCISYKRKHVMGRTSIWFNSWFRICIVFQKIYSKTKKYKWEEEGYNEEEDPFLKHFDENGNFIEHIEEIPEVIDDKPKRKITITYQFKRSKKD